MLPHSRRDLLILLALCAVLFGWGLGRIGLIDPDEPFYAETAVEMSDHHDPLVPRIFGAPQFEKPILFYWASMASFAGLGRTELAARLPGAVCAVLLAVMTWAFGVHLFGRRAGFLAALVLATSGVYVVVARLMLTDMMFALFVCGSCFAFWRAFDDRRPRPGMIVAALAGSALAVLTKGPLGLLIPALAVAVYGIVTRRPLPGSRRAWALGLAAAAVIAVPWYAYMIQRFGRTYVDAFFVHENIGRLLHAEHRSNNHVYYYPAVLLVGMVPWMPALAIALSRARRARPRPSAPTYLAGWILSSVAFFTLCQSKLPTYILFVFVPLALLVGRELDRLLERGFESRLERGLAVAFGLLQVVGLLAVFALPEQSRFIPVAGATAGVLALALAALLMTRLRAWIGLSAAAMAVFVGVAVTASARRIEEVMSIRPVVEQVLGRATPGSLRLLSSPILARGLFYYTRRPLGVVTDQPRPFFSPHPLPIVRGGDSLIAFVRRNGSTLCVARGRDWQRVRPNALVADSVGIGDKVIVRLDAPAAGALTVE